MTAGTITRSQSTQTLAICTRAASRPAADARGRRQRLRREQPERRRRRFDPARVRHRAAGDSGAGITLDGDELSIESAGASSGPITASTGSTLEVGNRYLPEATLGVGGSGVTLNTSDALGFAVDGNSTTLGAAASELTAANVDLSGVALYIDQGDGTSGSSCDTLTPDNTYTLVSVTGTLSDGGDGLTYSGADGGNQTLQQGQTGTAPLALTTTAAAPATRWR
jgi:hypothetical protein